MPEDVAEVVESLSRSVSGALFFDGFETPFIRLLCRDIQLFLGEKGSDAGE